MASIKNAKQKKKYIVFQIFLTGLLFTFLACAFTWLVIFFKGWYSILIQQTGLPEEIHLSKEICERNYEALVNYNMFFGPSVLSLPDFKMSMGGAIHFREVKEIFVTMQYIAIGTGIALIPSFCFAKTLRCRRFLKWTAFLIVEFTAIMAIIFIIDWEGFFTLFHKLCFNNNFWEFTVKEDPVILILPDGVFITGGVLIFTLLLISAGVMAATYYFTGKTKRKPGKPKTRAKKRK